MTTDSPTPSSVNPDSGTHEHSSSDPIAKFKAAFHRGGQRVHLNNAGDAPMCLPAFQAVAHWSQRFMEDGNVAVLEAYQAVEGVRGTVAKFMGARASEVAFMQGTAVAISQVALAFPFREGDEILVWDQEYPSNLYPWHIAAQRAGAKLVLAPSGENLSTPVEALLSKVTERTRVIAFSWIQYRTGATTDIEEVTRFARSKGIFTCADVVQGVGQQPFDFAASGLDAACSGSHKWMAAAPSTGILLLRSEHHLSLQPIAIGAMTYGGANSFFSPDEPSKTDARRFEAGSKNLLDILALGASTKLFIEVGISRIAQEVDWLSRTLLHGLQARGYTVHSPHGRHHRGSIVNFTPGEATAARTLDEIKTRLGSVPSTFGVRPPGIRLSPHAFNTASDIERVLQALD